MSGTWVAVLGFGGMLALIGLRLHVGLAMFVTGCIGYAYLSSTSALFGFLKTNAYNLFATYTLSVIPLFILMGALAERSGLSTALFKAASGLVGHRRGGMAMGVIGACTAFGAICGSSVATTATFGRAALPELLRHKYDGGFATGTIAVGGTLGILIPPSLILVIYAITVEQNIAKLFMAAFVPGLLAASFYLVTIALVLRLRPDLAPPGAPPAKGDRRRHLKTVWPAILVAVLVVGGIYGGVFTPTEGAAVGTVALLVIGVAQRTLGLTALRTSILMMGSRSRSWSARTRTASPMTPRI